MIRSSHLASVLALALTACSAPIQTTPTTPAPPVARPTQPQEVGEPQLQLAVADATGAVAVLDLASGDETGLGSAAPGSVLTTDGRFLFSAHADGVDVVDSGVWAWNHGDHSHYYRAAPTRVGTLAGSGGATVTASQDPTSGLTGVFFDASGTAVLLSNKAAGEGRLVETLRLTTEPHEGLVVPLADSALLTAPSTGSQPATVRLVDAEGNTQASVRCSRPAGTATTPAASVIGCKEGAVLANGDETRSLDLVAYPKASAAAPATSLAGRKGRPRVAGLGRDRGFWILDTRQREWTWHPTDVDLLAASAVDDAEGHVVAVAADGTVRVYRATDGKLLATTAATLASSATDPRLRSLITIAVDANRAYVNSPADGTVLEIDFASSARITRTLTPSISASSIALVGG